MKDVITVKTMRESDAHTIEQYVPSKELMYRAAMGVYRAAEWKGRIGILTGSGNNGGDGYALACILADRGIESCVYRVSEKFSEDGAYYYDMAVEKGVRTELFREDQDLSGYDILVDCMLGTGFSGTVRGLFRAAIQAINASEAYVISVDINSGMNGDTGEAELAVRSDLTVTIGYLKSGMFMGQSLDYIGALAVAEIGIRLIREDYFLASPQEVVFPHSGLSLDKDHVEILTPGELAGMLKPDETLIQAAAARALQEQKIVRVLNKNSLVTDGYRTYFLEDDVFPRTISSLGEQSADRE